MLVASLVDEEPELRGCLMEAETEQRGDLERLIPVHRENVVSRLSFTERQELRLVELVRVEDGGRRGGDGLSSECTDGVQVCLAEDDEIILEVNIVAAGNGRVRYFLKRMTVVK